MHITSNATGSEALHYLVLLIKRYLKTTDFFATTQTAFRLKMLLNAYRYATNVIDTIAQ
jgi:hypothetical protein